MNTPDRKQKVQEMFAASGSNIWKRLYENPTDVFEDNMNLRRQYVAEFVRQNIPVGSNILDLGCGAGVIAEDLLHASAKVVAMDLSAEMVSSTRERLQSIAPERSSVLRGDCEKLPFRDGEFDAVVCLGVISFVQSNDAVISEIYRTLRPGGTMILAVRNRRSMPRFLDVVLIVRRFAGRIFRASRRLIRGQWKPEQKEVPIPRLFHLPRLIRSLRDDGFAMLEKKHIGYGPFTIHGKEILSPTRSISLSRALDRLLQFPGLRILQGTADVCVIIATKQAKKATQKTKDLDPITLPTEGA